ncbi:hypothetical protein [Streptomyces turgidiscabies]|uniref:hypothetical protein n=1 Tax=Streptomyces turgidiscabies TaxID=85558 RepID=UPI0038F6A02D
MGDYKVKQRIVPTLPDGRLALTHWTPGQVARVFMDYREGFIEQPLSNDLDDFFRHLSYAELTFTPERATDEPFDWGMHWERVDSERMPDKTFEMIKTQTETGQDYFVCRVREDLIKRELVREINENIPAQGGLLRYSRNVRDVFWQRAQALADGLEGWAV